MNDFFTVHPYRIKFLEEVECFSGDRYCSSPSLAYDTVVSYKGAMRIAGGNRQPSFRISMFSGVSWIDIDEITLENLARKQKTMPGNGACHKHNAA